MLNLMCCWSNGQVLEREHKALEKGQHWAKKKAIIFKTDFAQVQISEIRPFLANQLCIVN